MIRGVYRARADRLCSSRLGPGDRTHTGFSRFRIRAALHSIRVWNCLYRGRGSRTTGEGALDHYVQTRRKQFSSWKNFVTILCSLIVGGFGARRFTLLHVALINSPLRIVTALSRILHCARPLLPAHRTRFLQYCWDRLEVTAVRWKGVRGWARHTSRYLEPRVLYTSLISGARSARRSPLTWCTALDYRCLPNTGRTL